MMGDNQLPGRQPTTVRPAHNRNVAPHPEGSLFAGLSMIVLLLMFEWRAKQGAAGFSLREASYRTDSPIFPITPI